MYVCMYIYRIVYIYFPGDLYRVYTGEVVYGSTSGYIV